jgi:hypothetical protein
MTFLGITFNSQSPWPLLITAVIAVVAYWILNRLASALKETWDEANYAGPEQ